MHYILLNKGDKVFDLEHNCEAVILDNYGNALQGDGGEMRTDMNGNVAIFTYDADWNRTGYNLQLIAKK
jgi:hypothetical protein